MEADLTNSRSLIDAIQGSTYVVHTASPVDITIPKNEDDLIKPAVDGTLAVMKGCQISKVKRIVITSSVEAIRTNVKEHFTPADWSDPDHDPPYQKSKHLAEKAAWEFIARLPDEEKFELAVINPGFIVGPNLNSAQFLSGDSIGKFMTGVVPSVPQISVPMIDVRDCALAHLRALKAPEAAGKRFILSENTYSLMDIASTLHDGYAHLGYPVPTRPMPYILIWIGSFFVEDAKSALQFWGRKATFDNSSTKQILGIEFTPIRKSLLDMAQSLIDTGYIPDYTKNGGKRPIYHSLWLLILAIITISFLVYSLNIGY